MKKISLMLSVITLIGLLFNSCFFYTFPTHYYEGISNIIYDGNYIAFTRAKFENESGWTYLGEGEGYYLVGYKNIVIDVSANKTYARYIDTGSEYVAWWDNVPPTFNCKTNNNIYFGSTADKFSVENKLWSDIDDTLFSASYNFFISPDETEVMKLESSGYLSYYNVMTEERIKFYVGQSNADVHWEYGLIAAERAEGSVAIIRFREDTLSSEIIDTSPSAIDKLRWYKNTLFILNGTSLHTLEQDDSTWQETDQLEGRYYYMADDSSYINFEDGIINVYDKNDNLIKKYEI